MLNGKAIERADMIVAECSHQAKQAKEQSLALEQNKRKKKGTAGNQSTPRVAEKARFHSWFVTHLMANIVSNGEQYQWKDYDPINFY